MTDFWEEDGAMVMEALENIRAAFQVVIEYIAAAWEWLWPYLENIIGSFIDVILDLVGVFAAIFAGDWDTLKEKLIDLTLDLMDLLFGVFSLGFDLVMAGFEAFANAVLALMTSAWNLMLGGLEGMINKAVDMLNSLISAMNKVPGVNIPLIGKVSFERAEAPTVSLPSMEDLTGGKSPSDAIREALDLEVAEEEEIAPVDDDSELAAKKKELDAILMKEAVTGTAEEMKAAMEAATPAAPVVETPTTTTTTEITETTETQTSDISEVVTDTTENISYVDSSGIITAINAISFDAVVSAIDTARDWLLEAFGYEIVIDDTSETPTQILVPISDITDSSSEIIEVSEEEEITTDTTETKEQETDNKIDLDMPLMGLPKLSINIPDFAASLRGLVFDLVSSVVVPALDIPEPQVTMPPIIQKQTLEIPVTIDGYEVGRAIYKDWNRRTGGGLNI
jgi:hypothetical protein